MADQVFRVFENELPCKAIPFRAIDISIFFRSGEFKPSATEEKCEKKYYYGIDTTLVYQPKGNNNNLSY